MKTKLFMSMVIFMMTLISCQKEESINSIEDIDARIETEAESYLSQFDSYGIEYLSLDELNVIYIKNGLKPLRLEDLNKTEQEYQDAQNRINSGVEFRCSGASKLAVFSGDWNGNGTLSNSDLVGAQNALGRIENTKTERFGKMSHIYHNIENDIFTEFDIETAEEVVLGFLPCI